MTARPVHSVKIDMSKADIAFRVRVVAQKDIQDDTLEVRAYDNGNQGSKEPSAVVVMSRAQWDEWRFVANEMMNALAGRSSGDVI